jgi:predicted permease
VPIIPHVSLELPVLLFAAAVSLVTAFLFGLVPAIQAARNSNLNIAMKNAPRVNLRDFLVAVQVALSVVLIIGSILVVRSLQHALSLNLGFQPEHAVVLSFDLAGQGYNEERGREFQRKLLEKIRATPGIESAGTTDGLPLTLNISNSSILFEGKPEPKPGDVPVAAAYYISPGYLQAMGTRLLAGRDIDERDKKDAPRVGLVNHAFVHQLMNDENPIGKRYRHGTDGKWIEIAGVVEDGKYRSLSESPMPTFFEPLEQGWSQGQTLIARSRLSETETLGLLKRAVFELDPTLAVFEDGGLEKRLGLALFPARLVAVILASFGLLAVVLAATGVYGIMAYAVARRTREIGIRMALGAAPMQVARAVLTHTTIMLAVGVSLGLILAFASGQFFGQILYGISSHDPLTYITAFAIMSVVALIACWFPARRAIKIDPLKALRTD